MVAGLVMTMPTTEAKTNPKPPSSVSAINDIKPLPENLTRRPVSRLSSAPKPKAKTVATPKPKIVKAPSKAKISRNSVDTMPQLNGVNWGDYSVPSWVTNPKPATQVNPTPNYGMDAYCLVVCS